MKNVLKVGAVVIAIVIALAVGSRSQVDPAYDGWAQTEFTQGIFLSPGPITGDINRDGKVTSADILALRALRNFIHLADVNGDNKVNEKDEQYLTNYVLFGGNAPKERTRCRALKVDANCWIDGEPIK